MKKYTWCLSFIPKISVTPSTLFQQYQIKLREQSRHNTTISSKYFHPISPRYSKGASCSILPVLETTHNSIISTIYPFTSHEAKYTTSDPPLIISFFLLILQKKMFLKVLLFVFNPSMYIFNALITRWRKLFQLLMLIFFIWSLRVSTINTFVANL